jgi:acetyl-CoA acetyltransferase
MNNVAAFKAGFRDKCAVAGIGNTEFSRASGRSELRLALEASVAATADAGLIPSQIDGIVKSDWDNVGIDALADSLGVENLAFWGVGAVAGGSPCGMVGLAVAAITSGQANTVLVYRSLNGRSGRRYGSSQASVSSPPVGGGSTYEEFFFPYGMITPGQYFAMVARRHMIEFGTTPEQLGQIAVTCRARANQNPNAQMSSKLLSISDYLDSPTLAAPLRLNDYSLETDGACALIVTSAERARDGRQPPALIRSVSQATGSDVQPGLLFPPLTRRDITELPSTIASQLLYERAGLRPQDIDVAQLYDCFTITALLQLESYGFCKHGEGGAFVGDGGIDFDSGLPINTAGGNLSEGYIHGMSHILEGVRQIRGSSTAQVPDAEVCLVTSAPSPHASALILTADS